MNTVFSPRRGRANSDAEATPPPRTPTLHRERSVEVISRQNSHPSIDLDPDDQPLEALERRQSFTERRQTMFEPPAAIQTNNLTPPGNRLQLMTSPFGKGSSVELRPPSLNNNGRKEADQRPDRFLGHHGRKSSKSQLLQRVGSSRIWNALVTSMFEKSQTVPGFEGSVCGSDGEGTVLSAKFSGEEIHPVELAVAHSLENDETMTDVERTKNGLTFAHEQLEGCFREYYRRRYGTVASKVPARAVFLLICIVAYLVAPAAATPSMSVFPCITFAAIAASVRIDKASSSLTSAVNAMTIVPMFAALNYAIGEDMHTTAATAEVLLTIVAGSAVFLLGLRPWDVVLVVVGPLLVAVATWAIVTGLADRPDDIADVWAIGRFVLAALVLTSILLRASVAIETSVRQRYLWLLRARAARKKANDLLVRLVPPHILSKIRDGRKLETRRHPMVSIMFVEIVDFDKKTQHAPPKLPIHMLNAIFGAFDEIVAKTPAQKVESINAIYMVEAGVTNTVHDHIELLFDIARKIAEAAQRRKMPTTSNESEHIQLRIGIHSGAVISGVIEKRLPRFRLFGDTVNTASRMCTTCPPNSIQLSGASYNELFEMGAAPKYSEGEEARTIEVKGKGAMETHVYPLRDPEIVRREEVFDVCNIGYISTPKRYTPSPTTLATRDRARSPSPLRSPRDPLPPLQSTRVSVSAKPLKPTPKFRAAPPTPLSAIPRQRSGMWGEVRSPSATGASPAASDSVFSPFSDAPTTVPSTAGNNGGTPTANNGGALWSTTPKGARRGSLDLIGPADTPITPTKPLPVSKMESFNFKDVTVIQHNDKEVSQNELDIPETISQKLSVHKVISQLATLRFSSPEWMEDAYTQATRRIGTRYAKRVVRNAVVTAGLVLAGTASSVMFVQCTDSYPLMLLAFVGGAANAAGLALQKRLNAKAPTGLRALVVANALATAIFLALMTGDDHGQDGGATGHDPVVTLCGASLSPLASIHVLLLVLAVLACCSGLPFATFAPASLATGLAFVVASNHAGAEADWILAVNWLVACAYVYTREKATREDFVTEVHVRNDRHICYHFGAKLLPKKVMKTMTTIHAVEHAVATANKRVEYANRDEDVAMLYADIVGFTSLCNSAPADDVINMLRELFANLDEAAERFGVCKLETIGDAYWAAANLPERSGRDGDDAIYGIACFALEIPKIIARFSIGSSPPLQMRVGISYGAVSTGVVGHISPRYHAFGPIVTEAQRMESRATAGTVIVTPQFSLRLQEAMRRHNFPEINLCNQSGDADAPLVMRSYEAHELGCEVVAETETDAPEAAMASECSTRPAMDSIASDQGIDPKMRTPRGQPGVCAITGLLMDDEVEAEEEEEEIVDVA